MARPLDLQEPAIALVAHQRLVALPQLLAQSRHNGLAVRAVLLDLVLIDAHHVAAPVYHHFLHLHRRRVLGVRALGMDHTKAPAIREHLFADLIVAAHAGAEDVRPTLLVQVVHDFPADHAAVRDDADLDDAEAAVEPVHDRDQRLDIGGVARPHLTADRPAVAVEHGADDHLLEVGAVVLAVPVLPQLVTAFALEIDRRGVEEHHLGVREQVAAALKYPFLD